MQRKFRHESLERVPIKWHHLIDKDSLKIKVLEHVLIEKVEQLFSERSPWPRGIAIRAPMEALRLVNAATATA
jgi:hypothetical protein